MRTDTHAVSNLDTRDISRRARLKILGRTTATSHSRMRERVGLLVAETDAESNQIQWWIGKDTPESQEGWVGDDE